MLSVRRGVVGAACLGWAAAVFTVIGCDSRPGPPAAGPAALPDQAAAPAPPQPLPAIPNPASAAAPGTAPPAPVASSSGVTPQAPPAVTSVPQTPLSVPFAIDARAVNAVVAPDGDALAVALETGWIIPWQVNPPVAKSRLQSNPQAPTLALSADGRLLLVGERAQRKLVFWDVAARTNVAGIFDKSASACSAVAISPAGNAAVGVFTRQDIDQSSLSIYMLPAVAPGQPVWNRQTRPEPSVWTPGLVMAAVFSPDGRHLALAGSKGVSLLDVATRQAVPSFQFASSASRVAYAPAGDVLAVATPAATTAPQGRLLLLDAATGSEQASLDNPAAEITAIAFSSDGKHLVGGDATGELLIWDAGTRKLVVHIRAARAPDSQLSFTREGNRLFAVVNGVAMLFELDALIARDQRLQSATFEFLPADQ